LPYTKYIIDKIELVHSYIKKGEFHKDINCTFEDVLPFHMTDKIKHIGPLFAKACKAQINIYL